MANPFAFSSPFCGESMRFCLFRIESKKRRKLLGKEVEKYNGSVNVSVIDSHGIILVEDEHANSYSDYKAGPPIFKASYVERCIEEKRVLDVTDFLVSNILMKENLNFMDVVHLQTLPWDPFLPFRRANQTELSWAPMLRLVLPFHLPHNNAVRGPVNVVVTQRNAVQGPVNVVVTQHNTVQGQNNAVDVDARHVHGASGERDRNIQNAEEPNEKFREMTNQLAPSANFRYLDPSYRTDVVESPRESSRAKLVVLSPELQSPNPQYSNALQAFANVIITPRDDAVDVARHDGQIVTEEEDGNIQNIIAKPMYETSGQFDSDEIFTQKSCSVESTDSHSTPTFNHPKEDINSLKTSDSSESNSPPTEGDAPSSVPVANEESNSSSCKFGCNIPRSRNSRTRLRQHYLENHGADFCTACPYCGEKFYLEKELNAHFRMCSPKVMIDSQLYQGYWNEIEILIDCSIKRSRHKKLRHSRLALRYLKSLSEQYIGLKTPECIFKPYHVPKDSEALKPVSIWNVSGCKLNRWAENDSDSYDTAYEKLDKGGDVALALSVIPDTIFKKTFADEVKRRYPTQNHPNLSEWILQPCFSVGECRHPYEYPEMRSCLDVIRRS